MDQPSQKQLKSSDEERVSIYFRRSSRLLYDFFDVPCLNLAKNLLGTILVRKLPDGNILKGKIVETECYLGFEDKASFSYNGRRTARNEPMFMDPGTIFVYQTYGMYYCCNVSSQGLRNFRSPDVFLKDVVRACVVIVGQGAAVLLRAIEPLNGLEKMSENRSTYHSKRKNKTNDKVKVQAGKDNFKPFQLCNGPSKLCISFEIVIESCNKRSLIDFSDMWIEERMDQITEDDIVSSSRIGIDSAGKEWASKLLRFYLFDNKSVSVRDMKQEAIRNQKF